MKRAASRAGGRPARSALRPGLPALRHGTQLRGAKPSLLRAQQQRRAPRRARAPAARRKRWWLAALLLLALALLWLRPPARAQPAESAAKQPERRATAPEHKAAREPTPPPAKPAAAAPVKTAQVKKPAAPPPPDGISRELLLAAVQSRSPSLRACALPPGSPARLSARLRIRRAGELRTVQFVNAEPLPRPLAECLRTTLQRWTFKDLPLKSDVEVLVDFLLGA